MKNKRQEKNIKKPRFYNLIKPRTFSAGITLIALVVTIVVLLILAGVSINLVIGQNGIINKAVEAKDKTEQAKVNEQTEMDNLYDEMLSAMGELQKTEETTPYLPSSDFKQVAGTNLDNGLVIQDGKGNQYVWVEVPKTIYNNIEYNLDTSLTPNVSKKPNSDTDYDNIEFCLHKYTETYRDGTKFADKWYAKDGETIVTEDTEGLTDLQKTLTNGCGLNYEQYINLRKKMLKSIYNNGGFWIGRYEAGIAETDNRTSHSDITSSSILPVSKENQCPYTYVTCSEAQLLASRINSGTCTSSLMFGVQWDLVLKYIETKKSETITDIQTKLNSDSSDIGNYNTSTFTINRGKYATMMRGPLSTWNDYTVDTEDFVMNQKMLSLQNGTGCGVLLTTGASDRNSLQNIYDIAGNVDEWTLEKTVRDDYPGAFRGGNFYGNGTFYKASYRGNDSTAFSNCNLGLGFRIALY